MRIDSNTVMVSFRGNGYTDRQTVQSFLLYRCAQVTLEDGYDYFVLISADTEARQGAIATLRTLCEYLDQERYELVRRWLAERKVRESEK